MYNQQTNRVPATCPQHRSLIIPVPIVDNKYLSLDLLNVTYKHEKPDEVASLYFMPKNFNCKGDDMCALLNSDEIIEVSGEQFLKELGDLERRLGDEDLNQELIEMMMIRERYFKEQ